MFHRGVAHALLPKNDYLYKFDLVSLHVILRERKMPVKASRHIVPVCVSVTCLPL